MRILKRTPGHLTLELKTVEAQCLMLVLECGAGLDATKEFAEPLLAQYELALQAWTAEFGYPECTQPIRETEPESGMQYNRDCNECPNCRIANARLTSETKGKK